MLTRHFSSFVIPHSTAGKSDLSIRSDFSIRCQHNGFIKRQSADDDLEGSGDNANPTRVDEEPDSPDEGTGDPILEGPTTEPPPGAATPLPPVPESSDSETPTTSTTKDDVDSEVPTETPTVQPETVADVPAEEPKPPVVPEEPTVQSETPAPAPIEEPVTSPPQPSEGPPAPTEPEKNAAEETGKPSEGVTDGSPPLAEPNTEPPAPIQERVEPNKEAETPPPSESPEDKNATLVSTPPQSQDEPSPQFNPGGPPPPVPVTPRRVGGSRLPGPNGELGDENLNSTDSDFSIDDGTQTNTPSTNLTTSGLEPGSLPQPISEQQPPLTDADSTGALPNSSGTNSTTGNGTLSPGQGTATTGGASGSSDPESLETGNLKKSSDSWSIIPVDELSLLIFILLCLILIVILLVCCFILQNMTHWAIIKVDKSGGTPRGTYENVCPIKGEHEDDSGTVRYTIEPDEKEGMVEFVSFTKPPPPVTSTRTFTLEQKPPTAEVHCSTVEVILTGEPKPNASNPNSKPDNTRLIPVVPTHRPTSDPWIRDVLKKIENEDAEPEPVQSEFNELKTFTKPPKVVEPEYKKGVPKYAVVTPLTHKPVSQTAEAPNSNRLNVDKLDGDRSRSGSRKSFDDFSGDELDDYLDNSNFPV